MSKEHIIHNFLVNDRCLIHQSVNFPPGSTFLNPLEQEDEAIDRTKKKKRYHFSYVVATAQEKEHCLYSDMSLVVTTWHTCQVVSYCSPIYIPLTLALKIIDFLYLDTFDTYRIITHIDILIDFISSKSPAQSYTCFFFKLQHCERFSDCLALLYMSYSPKSSTSKVNSPEKTKHCI